MRCIGYIERAEEINRVVFKKSSKEAVTIGDREDTEDDIGVLRKKLLEAIITDRPQIGWNDVAGLNEAKDNIKLATIIPTIHPEIFCGKRKPWIGILLFGPPGTGKSYLAKATASQSNSTFFSVSAADLVSKYVGESARLVKALFSLAREKKPSIIFIDEIDSLCVKRNSDEQHGSSKQVLTELLVQMDGVGNDMSSILVIGATNLPWDIDPAMRRRFQKRIYIPLPDEKARVELFRLHFGKEGHTLTEKDFRYLAKHTDGFSGSDIENFAKNALMHPVRRFHKADHFNKNQSNRWKPSNDGSGIQTDIYQLEKDTVEIPIFTSKMIPKVISRFKPSVSKDDLKQYEDWKNEFGEDGV